MTYKVKNRIKRRFTKRQAAKDISKEAIKVFSYMKDLFLFIMKGMALVVSLMFLWFVYTDVVEPTVEHFEQTSEFNNK